MPADVIALKARFLARQAKLGIIGMGYVGLPLMLAATARGFAVLGFDIDAPKVAGLNQGRSPLRHVGDASVAQARASGRFEATGDFARLAEADAVLVCVPTPLGPHRAPDLTYVEATARSIGAFLRQGQLIVLESTTWPGTTREVVKPLLEASGLRSGQDFFLAYSPEREDPGNPAFTTAAIPKLVGGDGAEALDLAATLYGEIVAETIQVDSLETAEAAKLTENIFRAVNIALVNELKVVFTAMGIDVFQVIKAASSKPFGYMPFYPGPGLGGHCIPIDPFYLAWRAQEFGVTTRFIELAGEVNTGLPAWVIGRLAQALDARFRKGLNGTSVLIVGVAYKRNVDDVRESPAFALWELLAARGAEVAFHDPFVAAIPSTREHGHLAGQRSLPLTPESVAGFDAILIVTDHDAVDWPVIEAHARLIVDTRNRLAAGPAADRVVAA